MTDPFPKPTPDAGGADGPALDRQPPFTRPAWAGACQDTADGCRAQAEADLQRLDSPADDEDRCTCALSAAAWLSRADRLERLAAECRIHGGRSGR